MAGLDKIATGADRPVLWRLGVIAGALLGLLAVAPGAAAQIDSATAPSAQPLAPVTGLAVEDFKYDSGEQLVLRWTLSADDNPQQRRVQTYEIYRLTDDSPAEKIAVLPYDTAAFSDHELSPRHRYRYYVLAVGDGLPAASDTTAALSPGREWIDLGRWNLLAIALIIGGAVVFFIETAKRGKKLYVRKIAGLEAVDEAIGRATEMGRPILFIPGIHDMDDVQTLAALTILGRVAQQVATYDTKIRMPVSRSLVMTAGRETIKAGYQAAGRPDAYSDDMVQYVTDEQFGYVAAVDGIMVRERPATVFLLGAFFAESLILAETGNYVGAIQIAGTARPAQLPFFIAACDFTLIGEELFAASAYLSGEPRALGSLKGQDVGKGIAMAAIVIGVLAATLSEVTGAGFFASVYDFMIGLFSTQ